MGFWSLSTQNPTRPITYTILPRSEPETRIFRHPKSSLNLKDPEFNEDALLVTAMDLFGAGSETTATTLSWALLYMILYPEIQIKVHAEIDQVLAGKEPSLDDRIQ